MKKDTATRKTVDPHPVLSLPFVADLPDPNNPRKSVRTFWKIPDEADYGEACDIGCRWGTDFVKYSRRRNDSILIIIIHAIADRVAPLPRFSGSRGFGVGFCYAIEHLLALGGRCVGEEEKWFLEKQARSRRAREEIEAVHQVSVAVRVARMNAAKAAKRKQACRV